MDKRPKLNKNIKIEDFKDFYWLKEELVEFCRIEDLNKQGGKIELADRIEEYLKTGKIIHRHEKPNIKPKSKFNWNREAITLQTKITDNYKNTEMDRLYRLP
ncbi:hypothetical protein H8E88_08035 [candidate division KSB1 bacterium]|nr:hypothetical protein [candidate division KSB1 bacterium]